jgi:hypothetical protein
MKPKPLSNGLSTRANRCLSTAGIPAEKEAVLHALKTGALYPYFRPALYGKKTHHEVCRWARLDESFVPPTIPQGTMPLAIENGLSDRTNHLLFMPGIPADKAAVLLALQSGALRPRKCPVIIAAGCCTSMSCRVLRRFGRPNNSWKPFPLPLPHGCLLRDRNAIYGLEFQKRA